MSIGELVVELINSVGMGGFLGLSGCYLIVVAIVNRFVPRNIRVGSILQRILLACFGVILAIPVIRIAYIDQQTAAIISPKTPPEYVRTPDRLNSLLDKNKLFRRANFSFHESNKLESNKFQIYGAQVQRDGNCQKVEGFTLKQNSIRRLKYANFQNQVYVYLGDIETFQNSNLYIFSDDSNAWPSSGYMKESKFNRRIGSKDKKILRFMKKNVSVIFEHGRDKYRLTIVDIYNILLGQDRAIVEICQIMDSRSRAS